MKTNTGIIYTATKTTVKTSITVKIRLDDECGNGRADFSLTCSGKRKERGIWVDAFGGCDHETILKYWPEFSDFAALHLSDCHGAPMYAIENGLYILKTKGIEAAADYLRISTEEAARLIANDKKYSIYMLMKMGVFDRWQKEADEAIAHLESLTGDTFVNPYDETTERRNACPLTPDEFEEIETLVKSGYYTTDAIEVRETTKRNAEREKARAAIVERFDKDIAKAARQKTVYLAVFDILGTTENIIFYDHCNSVSFNWRTYGEKWTREQFDQFVKAAANKPEFQGIDFELR